MKIKELMGTQLIVELVFNESFEICDVGEILLRSTPSDLKSSSEAAFATGILAKTGDFALF